MDLDEDAQYRSDGQRRPGYRSELTVSIDGVDHHEDKDRRSADAGVAPDPVVTEELKPILRDVYTSGAPSPRIDQAISRHAGETTVRLWAPDGTCAGVTVFWQLDRSARLMSAADQFQEWVIEELARSGQSTSWPSCPTHPDTHPLRARVVLGEAMWVCATVDMPIAHIGGLNPP